MLFSILGLGLSAGAVSSYGSYDRTNFAVAVSVISFIYLVVTFVAYRFISPFISLIAESILFIFWLAAFAAVADVFGSATCSYHGFFGSFDSSGCKTSKAFIAFGVLNWILFGITLGLLIAYTIVPFARAGGFKKLLESNSLTMGALFSSFTPSAGAKDLEAGPVVGADVASGADSVPEDKVESVNRDPSVDSHHEPTTTQAQL